MPSYVFVCDREECKNPVERIVPMRDHDELKKNIRCEKCGSTMSQEIPNQFRFKLKGNGWSDQEYGITDMETDKNLDGEKRIEEIAKDYVRADREANRK